MLPTPLDVVLTEESLPRTKAPRYREAVYRAVKDAILSGQLLPNQPLIEEQLASSLNISRTPVREALALLEYENFIGPRGGRGLYVRAVTQSEFIEMFVANEAVEPYLARRAALLATKQQLDHMKDAIVRAQQSAGYFEMAGFLQASRDFHRVLGEAADNRTLAQFVVRNEERTDMYLLNYGKIVEQQDMEESTNEHLAILGAVQARNPEAAERLVIYHAQSLRKRFAELFSEEATQ